VAESGYDVSGALASEGPRAVSAVVPRRYGDGTCDVSEEDRGLVLKERECMDSNNLLQVCYVT
jgi:hypothetical protein